MASAAAGAGEGRAGGAADGPVAGGAVADGPVAGGAADAARGEPPRDPPPAASHADGAPPGHTGGFGEPTCVRCHFDATAGEGRLEVTGFPAAWAPWGEYPVEVRLVSPGMRRAGFQLSVRFREGALAGRQAGTLRADEAGVRVVEGDSSGVAYAGHAEPGAVGADGRATWRVTWLAPSDTGAAAVLHVAANAANGDDSEFGDAIYTDSLSSAPVAGLEPPAAGVEPRAAGVDPAATGDGEAGDARDRTTAGRSERCPAKAWSRR